MQNRYRLWGGDHMLPSVHNCTDLYVTTDPINTIIIDTLTIAMIGTNLTVMIDPSTLIHVAFQNCIYYPIDGNLHPHHYDWSNFDNLGRPIHTIMIDTILIIVIDTIPQWFVSSALSIYALTIRIDPINAFAIIANLIPPPLWLIPICKPIHDRFHIHHDHSRHHHDLICTFTIHDRPNLWHHQRDRSHTIMVDAICTLMIDPVTLYNHVNGITFSRTAIFMMQLWRYNSDASLVMMYWSRSQAMSPYHIIDCIIMIYWSIFQMDGVIYGASMLQASTRGLCDWDVPIMCAVSIITDLYHHNGSWWHRPWIMFIRNGINHDADQISTERRWWYMWRCSTWW